MNYKNFVIFALLFSQCNAESSESAAAGAKTAADVAADEPCVDVTSTTSKANHDSKLNEKNFTKENLDNAIVNLSVAKQGIQKATADVEAFKETLLWK